VPLSSDLLAVQFPTSEVGWAVGHDGVVLRSADAGQSWQRVLDGRTLGTLMVQSYEKRLASGDASVAKALEDAKRMAQEGPTKPFLSVYFRNADEGWVVGQFNLILHTDDGGKTWEPWLDRTENPDGYSLHSIRGVGGKVVIVGELGLVLVLDQAGGRFRRLNSPYPGSWFAVAGTRRSIVAMGLRGSVWRSSDAGANWTMLKTNTEGAVNAGTVVDDGPLVLVTQQGSVLVGSVDGTTMEQIPRPEGVVNLYDALSVESGWLLLAGSRGVTRVRIPSPASSARP
jgi:photosystem II stability/assembly factor-like uncharacterized protein